MNRTTLTRREQQTVELLAEGHTTFEIAAMLGISQHTAREHSDRARAKLGARTAAHAVALYRDTVAAEPAA